MSQVSVATPYLQSKVIVGLGAFAVTGTWWLFPTTVEILLYYSLNCVGRVQIFVFLP